MRCVNYLFDKAQHYENYKNFEVTVSCLEINKDGIVDLGRQCQKSAKSGYRQASNAQIPVSIE